MLYRWKYHRTRLDDSSAPEKRQGREPSLPGMGMSMGVAVCIDMTVDMSMDMCFDIVMNTDIGMGMDLVLFSFY